MPATRYAHAWLGLSPISFSACSSASEWRPAPKSTTPSPFSANWLLGSISSARLKLASASRGRSAIVRRPPGAACRFASLGATARAAAQDPAASSTLSINVSRWIRYGQPLASVGASSQTRTACAKAASRRSGWSAHSSTRTRRGWMSLGSLSMAFKAAAAASSGFPSFT